MPGLRACPLQKRCSQVSIAAAAQWLLTTVTEPWYLMVQQHGLLTCSARLWLVALVGTRVGFTEITRYATG